MDEKETKKDEDFDEITYLGLLTSGINTMNTMSPVVPLILNDKETKEEREKKLRE